jgi:hypothetical protein
MKTTQRILLMSLFLFCGLPLSYSQQAPTVTIKAYQLIQADGSARYKYRIVNGSTKPIVGFAIGSDYYHGVSELVEPPIGWTFDTGLAGGSVTSPQSWNAILITTEESPYLEIEWRNTGTADIAPGRMAEGFSVVTQQPDVHYLKGNWTVFFADSTIESSLLVQDDNPNATDTTPPSITVSLTPNSIWPPNGVMHTINANISVHDDVDPNPMVKLVSITCNEDLGTADIVGANIGTDSRSFALRATRLGTDKVGRIYLVTYSATDYAGNTATATATVTVPHDKGN